DRRDRYVEEQYNKGTLVSLEYLAENNVPLDRISAEIVSDAEDEMLRRYNQEQLRAILLPVQNALKEQDRALVQALYFDEMSERAYAKSRGISYKTVQYHRNRILCEIRRTIFE
ncbi:MAG: sigma-70 family RNA polymerase sigma factor, partial [Abditibacteriota bacterium]|nr:sigma-70 family RNA polymerase sigma factor [Abditibacteriota bacterium]